MSDSELAQNQKKRQVWNR